MSNVCMNVIAIRKSINEAVTLNSHRMQETQSCPPPLSSTLETLPPYSSRRVQCVTANASLASPLAGSHGPCSIDNISSIADGHNDLPGDGGIITVGTIRVQA
jgi:hypothetical protein